MRSIVVLLSLALSVAAQGGFGPQQVITTSAASARSVYATDLDGDGDIDVLSASYSDDKIAWYENLGGGVFGSQQVISTTQNGPTSIVAKDLDGDGDADVLASSSIDDKISWYRNLGSGVFDTPSPVSYSVQTCQCINATDLDGDGDADVLWASWTGDKIGWIENLGGLFNWGSQQVISFNVDSATGVYATDLDGDGDNDVLSASAADDKVAWYENQGGGSFGAQQILTTNADGAYSVYATDLDGDGDNDVLSASAVDDKIAWYRNLGGGNFAAPQIITTSADSAWTVYAIDLDGDGDNDVLSASQFDHKIAWYENIGGGSFGPQQVITTSASGAQEVYAADMDGDGDADVLSASFLDDKIAWYENLIPPPVPPCPTGACLDLTTIAAIGTNLGIWLQSPAAHQPCYVIADTALYSDPAGFLVATIGSTTYYAHLLLGAGAIPLADPFGTFGPSLTNPYTDANGNWSMTLAIPNNPALVGATFYGEAFVHDPGLLPGGLFHQSNVLTVTVQ